MKTVVAHRTLRSLRTTGMVIRRKNVDAFTKFDHALAVWRKVPPQVPCRQLDLLQEARTYFAASGLRALARPVLADAVRAGGRRKSSGRASAAGGLSVISSGLASKRAQ